ncbi:MAG TPA: phosphatase PAP2 family protein [Terriglobales bacterium]
MERLKRQKLRICMWLLFFISLWYVSSLFKGVVLTIDVVALLELYGQLKPQERRKIAGSVLLPALYLFAGFLIVFAYNDAILSFRFYGLADPLFDSMDKWLLHGSSVSNLSKIALQHLPISFFYFLEFIYFAMFSQLGAGIILLGWFYGKRRGLQFVGTLLIAYYVALVIFYFWPSQGPPYLLLGHFSGFPRTLKAFSIQQALLQKSQLLWTHQPAGKISTDYFIAFPCMHIAQPLILLWFLRPWRRLIAVLAAYDVLLVVAIILLQWHYVVDVLAGILLAALAVCLTDFREFSRFARRSRALTHPKIAIPS